MSLYDIPLHTLSGGDTSLAEHKGKVVMVVNVASRCGATPQYEGLERLQQQYADRGFTVVGAPCNQEIATFCSTTYGVTFPMLAKLDVNGDTRHPLFTELTKTPDADGRAGDLGWNFEKFVLSPDGTVLARFRTPTQPESDEIVSLIEANLPG
jgi:glutathione peroxidase